jgi:sarcosine oxidase
VKQVEYVVIGLGALGSGTTYHLARGGHDVLGLERFDLGHERGASHDSSRILRHSYHTPAYVRLTMAAYDDWASLEEDHAQRLVLQTGGLDLFPPGGAIPIVDYTHSLSAWNIDYELIDSRAIQARWPMFAVPDGTVGLYQPRGSIVPAARGVAAMQDSARRFGAELRDHSQATGVRDLGVDGIEVLVGDDVVRCRRLVVCADAWTNEVLAGLGWSAPLTTTLEQVTYFEPEHPALLSPDLMPLWIWMDDPCYYGFPTYGEATVKAAEDCGGAVVTGDTRPFDPDPERMAQLADFMATTVPDSGPPVRSKTCLYTLTPDRDFMVGAVPGHESVFVGVGAGHAFKFSPTLGRILSELAVTGDTDADIEAFRLDRQALVDPDTTVHWLV